MKQPRDVLIGVASVPWSADTARLLITGTRTRSDEEQKRRFRGFQEKRATRTIFQPVRVRNERRMSDAGQKEASGSSICDSPVIGSTRDSSGASIYGTCIDSSLVSDCAFATIRTVNTQATKGETIFKLVTRGYNFNEMASNRDAPW